MGSSNLPSVDIYYSNINQSSSQAKNIMVTHSTKITKTNRFKQVNHDLTRETVNSSFIDMTL